MLEGYLWFSSENIKVGFTEKDRKFVEETSVALKKAIRFLSNYFHLKKNSPSIRTILVPNRGEYDRLVRELLRVDIENPSRPSRIAQTQRTDLVLLAPSAYSTDSIYQYSAEDYKRLVFHEATHIFEEYLSSNIEVLPRWWSEGLAVYLSEQWKYQDELREPVIKGLKNGEIPSFESIQRNIKFSYQWGWTIVKHIEHCWGREMMLNIIRNCTDGDVFKIIGETIRNFERRWRKYLEEEIKKCRL